MTIYQIGNLLGGIGLFLLGMKLMTDGLKEVAGPALRHILALWTSTPLRGLFSGVFITSAVQSSAAVTIATIGFVNAGLLTLMQTVYVIYGSNIGTTMTGWLVTLVGFDFDIKVLSNGTGRRAMTRAARRWAIVPGGPRRAIRWGPAQAVRSSARAAVAVVVAPRIAGRDVARRDRGCDRRRRSPVRADPGGARSPRPGLSRR